MLTQYKDDLLKEIAELSGTNETLNAEIENKDNQIAELKNNQLLRILTLINLTQIKLSLKKLVQKNITTFHRKTGFYTT